jgi:DNA-binding SARP family transcriptional activator/transcriptional regulator with XRE-family HTH domain
MVQDHVGGVAPEPYDYQIRAVSPGVGALFGTRRRTAGLTQAELACRAGVGVGTVRDLEQGRTRRPSSGSVRRLAMVLGMNVGWAEELARKALARSGEAAGHNGRRGSPLWLEVLGPLAAWRRGKPVGPSAAKCRVLLGVLAVTPNTWMHQEALIDAVWGQDPPATAVNLVRAYVSGLRGVLDPGRSPRDPAGLMISVGIGYRLQVTADQLDVLAFDQLAERGRTGCSRGEVVEACKAYEEALGMWRGQPLADVDVLRGHLAVIDIGRRHAAVICDYADAAFAARLSDRVLPYLWELAGSEPLDEKAHARLMIALGGTGQQAAALKVFEDLRCRLDADLGVRPGPELADAHVRVLRQDVPSATTRAPTVQNSRAAGGDAVPAVPRELPAAVGYFAGRQAELAALADLLDESAGSAGMLVISAIDGTAGVGKTALAVHFAHQVADRFPDGQLYVNLRGFGPAGQPVTSAATVRGFLDALGVPAGHIPASPDAQAGLYRSVLAGRRALILLDNARDANQIRPLLPAAPGCLVLITSRSQLAGLVAAEGAHLLTLGLLNDEEASELLARRLGDERIAAEPGSVRELTRLCARLPLALAIAAARAAARTAFPLAALAAEMRSAQGRLAALDAGDPASSVRVAFSWSYQALGAAAARMFRLLGLHPGPDISARAAASLAGISLVEARRLLAELAAAHLLTEHVPGRYTCHDLLRAYAAEQVAALDDDTARRAALARAFDHYRHTAYAAAGLLNPSREPVILDRPHPGVTPEHLADDQQALAWFDAEQRVLLSATTLAAQTGFDTCPWRLPWPDHAGLRYAAPGGLEENRGGPKLAQLDLPARRQRIQDRN